MTPRNADQVTATQQTEHFGTMTPRKADATTATQQTEHIGTMTPTKAETVMATQCTLSRTHWDDDADPADSVSNTLAR